MYVGFVMRKHVPVITSDTLLSRADALMEEHKLWILLVVEGDKLKGYVAKMDIRSALPSGAITFSRHELNYLMAQMTVKSLIRKDMPTVSPETPIEEAAQIMHDLDMAGLAVVDSQQRLKGYLSRSDMLAVLVEEMGLEQGGHRIVLEAVDRKGLMAEVCNLLFDMGVNILSTSTFFRRSKLMIVFRVQTDDLQAVLQALQDKGQKIVGPDMFAAEWA